MAGIKETLDWAKALQVAADQLNKASADGRIDWRDFEHLIPLIGAGNDAIKDSRLIAEELKDLDLDEAKHLVEQFLVSGMALWEVLRRILGNNGPEPQRAKYKTAAQVRAAKKAKAAPKK